MVEQSNSIFSKLRFVFVVLAILGNLLLLSLLQSTLRDAHVHKATGAPKFYATSSFETSDSPNAVTNALAATGNTLNGAWQSTLHAIGTAFASMGQSIRQSNGIVGTVGSGFAAVGRGIGGGTLAVIHGVGFGTMAVVHAIGAAGTAIVHGVAATILFVWHIPGHVFHFVASGTIVTALIRQPDSAPVPVIAADSPALAAARTALPATPPVAAAPAVAATATVVPMWPIHGAVTTEFGASDWPYEAVHTGIDISDGARPGTTPVHPYRPGKVIEAVHSSVSLGNHVVVDHGNGVTSVYGHLNSISVQAGQQVDQTTILGYEGTTGASTGTHLHFEIRVNGQAANPHQFISGNP